MTTEIHAVATASHISLIYGLAGLCRERRRRRRNCVRRRRRRSSTSGGEGRTFCRNEPRPAAPQSLMGSPQNGGLVINVFKSCKIQLLVQKLGRTSFYGLNLTILGALEIGMSYTCNVLGKSRISFSPPVTIINHIDLIISFKLDFSCVFSFCFCAPVTMLLFSVTMKNHIYVIISFKLDFTCVFSCPNR